MTHKSSDMETKVTTSFGPFQLVREIGSGSAARVYEARLGEQTVALKLFDPGKHYDERRAILREFQNEASAIRHLDHPNIVKVVDAGIIDDQPYIAMELLRFGSLEARLRSSDTIAVRDMGTILDPIADAIDYAHGRGVLHRDIKPSNVLFGESDRPVLSDFGVARFLPPRDESTTRSGFDVPGTTDFLAPEVLVEAPHSSASDVYSLGMTVYRALTGKLPTDGGTLFTRSRDRVAGQLFSVVKRNPNVSGPVSDVVMRALDRNPSNRFLSARDFSRAFSLAASDSPARTFVQPKPPDDEQKRTTTKWLDYWRYVLVPLLVALIGASVAWCQSGRAG